MKSKTNPFLRHSLPLAAGAAFLAMGSAHAATYDWTGSTDSLWKTDGNWVGGAYVEWGEYQFGSAVTNGTVDFTAASIFGTASLNLNSGLTTDITIGGSQPIIMAINQISGWGLPASTGQINIAAASKNLTINNIYQSNGAVTWDVGAGARSR